LTIRRQS